MKHNAVIGFLLLLCLAAGNARADSFAPKAYIKLSFAASYVLQKAEQNLIKAKNDYKTALFNAALPSLSATMSSDFYDDTNPAWRFNKNEINSGLSASWNLYNSVSSPLLKIKTAKMNLDAAELSYLIQEQQEASKALRRFYALYSAKQRVVVAKLNLTSREKQYVDTKEQYSSGIRSRIELTQSEGDKLQSELNVTGAEIAERQALVSFNELLNYDPNTPADLVISTDVAVSTPFPRADVDVALENNFNLRLSRINLELAKINYHSGFMSNLPELSVDAAWNGSATGVGKNSTGGTSYSLGGSITFPFGFLGFQNYWNINAQKAVLEAARKDLDSAVRLLKTQVLNSQLDIELQVKSVKLLDFQIAALKDTTDNLLTEYSLGNAQFLQLDNSQTKLLDARNNKVNAVNNLDIALSDYRVLMGEKIWE